MHPFLIDNVEFFDHTTLDSLSFPLLRRHDFSVVCCSLKLHTFSVHSYALSLYWETSRQSHFLVSFCGYLVQNHHMLFGVQLVLIPSYEMSSRSIDVLTSQLLDSLALCVIRLYFSLFLFPVCLIGQALVIWFWSLPLE